MLRLPPETYAHARSRLALLATGVATVFAIALVVNELFPIYDIIPGFASMNRLVNATGLAASLAMLAVCRWQAIGAHAAVFSGTVWEWVLCLLTGSLVVWVTANGYGHAPELTWAIPIMVMFPLIIPMPTALTLLVAVIAASMPMLGSWAMQAAGWIPPLEPRDWHDMVLNHYVVLPLPVLVSRVIHRLTIEAHRARVLGTYRLEERIGQGGMGEVWRATHRLLARPAAAKLVRPDLLGAMSLGARERAVHRFKREARVISKLTSPHTVQLYDFGLTEDGSAYYMMELLDGVDLETLVSTWGPLPPERVWHVLWQACESLSEAHARGLVHRDIKPANLFLCRKGNRVDHVVVLDFGLVALRPGLSSKHDLTIDGTVGGTPAYMAPEMVTGAPVDGRADLYALGCVAYFLLTGHRVFEAPSAFAILFKHANEAPIPPSQRSEAGLPAAVDQLVLRLLAKDPANRPQTADDVQDMLEQAGMEAWGKRQAHDWWDQHMPAPRVA